MQTEHTSPARLVRFGVRRSPRLDITRGGEMTGVPVSTVDLILKQVNLEGPERRWRRRYECCLRAIHELEAECGRDERGSRRHLRPAWRGESQGGCNDTTTFCRRCHPQPWQLSLHFAK